MIPPMRNLGGRLPVVIAGIVAGAMAIGYAFIFSGIAAPVRGDLATLDAPVDDDAVPAILDDGRPVFVVRDPDGAVNVLDAAGRAPTGAPGGLVGWCPESRLFIDPLDGSTFTADGRLLSGPAATGMVAFAARPAPDATGKVIVGSDTVARGRADSGADDGAGRCGDPLIVHEPRAGETFDPSVAADAEPPGWIWLEGSLRSVDGEARLCDDDDEACETYAPTLGIDRATLPDQSVGGRFIGRVRDGAIEGLLLVPDPMEAP